MYYLKTIKGRNGLSFTQYTVKFGLNYCKKITANTKDELISKLIETNAITDDTQTVEIVNNIRIRDKIINSIGYEWREVLADLNLNELNALFCNSFVFSYVW